MSDIITVAERLYYEANPNTKMDVPSYAYEQVEASNKRRIAANSDLSLYDWCKQEMKKTPDDVFREKQQAMSDSELAELVAEISELCKTGAKSFTMRVPPSVRDTDMLLSELVRRFKKLTTDMKSGIDLIVKERKEQIEKHGRTVEKDVANNSEYQLVHAMMLLLSNMGFQSIGIKEMPEEAFNDLRPDGWDITICRKMLSKPIIEQLQIVGAFAAAEIDRLSSLNSSENGN